MSDEQKRNALKRDHEPRTIRISSEIEPRISRADEQRFADQAEARREAERRAVAEERRRQVRQRNERIAANVREAREAVGRMADGLDHINQRTRHRLQNIRRELRKIQDEHTWPE